MKINVTQEHIQRGRPGCGSECALALAIQDACPGQPVHVGAANVDFVGHDHLIPLPYEAVVFVSRFDHGHDVSPFVLDLPIEAAALVCEHTSLACV